MLGFYILSRCSADKGYLTGKVTKIWPSLWEFGTIERVLMYPAGIMDHYDPTKENSA